MHGSLHLRRSWRASNATMLRRAPGAVRFGRLLPWFLLLGCGPGERAVGNPPTAANGGVRDLKASKGDERQTTEPTEATINEADLLQDLRLDRLEEYADTWERWWLERSDLTDHEPTQSGSGPLSLPAVISGLTRDDLDERRATLALLLREEAHREASDVVPLVSRLVSDRDVICRRRAALVLGRYGARAGAAVSTLIEALGDPDIVPEAMRALRQIGAASLPPLEEATRSDTSWRVRANALVLIGRLCRDEDTVLRVVHAALEDEDARVRETAAEVLDGAAGSR